MILAVDVHYGVHTALAAGVLFARWEDAQPAQVVTSVIPAIAPYEPGRFYRREQPCIEHLLTEHRLQPDLIVIDGYVYLDGEHRPGLGWHLHQALQGRTPVVGVAKTRFAGIPDDCAVSRGASRAPLYVTAVGVEPAQARAWVQAMAGTHRVPTLLKRVDQASRGLGAA